MSVLPFDDYFPTASLNTVKQICMLAVLGYISQRCIQYDKRVRHLFVVTVFRKSIFVVHSNWKLC